MDPFGTNVPSSPVINTSRDLGAGPPGNPDFVGGPRTKACAWAPVKLTESKLPDIQMENCNLKMKEINTGK